MACLISLTTAPFCFGETRQQMTSWSQQGWVGCCDVARMWNLLTHDGYERNDASHFSRHKRTCLSDTRLADFGNAVRGTVVQVRQIATKSCRLFEWLLIGRGKGCASTKILKTFTLSCNVNPKNIWRTPTFSHLFTFWSYIFHDWLFHSKEMVATKRNSGSIFPRKFLVLFILRLQGQFEAFPIDDHSLKHALPQNQTRGKTWNGVTKRGPWGFLWWNFVEKNIALRSGVLAPISPLWCWDWTYLNFY